MDLAKRAAEFSGVKHLAFTVAVAVVFKAMVRICYSVSKDLGSSRKSKRLI